MSWIFEGSVLPLGEIHRVELNAGDRDGRRSVSVLPGRFALPGMVDAHAHLTVRSDRSLGGLVLGRERLDAYAASGVSTVRDMGGRSSVTLGLVGRAADGVPAVSAAGRFLAPANRYFPELHDPVEAEELCAAATAEIAQGADWLKLIGDFPFLADGAVVPGTLAPTYDLDLVRAVVDLAHHHGARVAAHTQSEHVVDLVNAGVDSIEHGEWLTDDAVRALGARNGAWTPTLTAIVNPPESAPRRRKAYAAEASERLSTLLPLAIASGVQIMAGTDNAGSVAGEVALLIEHGLEPVEALAAASTAASSWLGHEETRPHSLVTFHHDPRDDAGVLSSPAAVVVRGRRLL